MDSRKQPFLQIGFVHYLQHFSEDEDGFVWLSEDHPVFTNKARKLHLCESEVVLIEKKGHTSYCGNCLKDSVNMQQTC